MNFPAVSSASPSNRASDASPDLSCLHWILLRQPRGIGDGMQVILVVLFQPPIPSALFWRVGHCFGVSRLTLLCDECSYEALPYGLINGLVFWGFVSIAFTTNPRIAFSAQVAVSSLNFGALLLLIVPQDALSLIVSNVVKVGGLLVDVVVLSVRFALAYPFIYSFWLSCMEFVAVLAFSHFVCTLGMSECDFLFVTV
ncbi:PREDICTED: uncharacterized protein LOC104713908 [Camelina sativa]|uniref:Uncharacterized protein LOC104713908 n=1 Tax=Camelina sativa TaxID=90675 RepID=A0ABM0TPS1_CAMSA|nr:PREDICTED: uncharacterized protein LOC104713908 [Camelina sativa]